MVPFAPLRDKQPSLRGLLRRLLQPWRLTLRPTSWSLLLWALVLALPWLELRGEEASLDGVVVRGLVWLLPLALVWAAFTGNTMTVFAVATVGLVPALVAAPPLIAANASSLRGLAVAVALVLLLASAVDRADTFASLRRLWRLPVRWSERLTLGLLPLWLGAAWLEASTGRVAAVALVWVAVVHLPLGAGHARMEQHRGRWLLARGLWLALVVAAWWLRPEVAP